MTISKNKHHQKHAALTRPILGNYARNEIAIMGTPCGNIKKLARTLIESLKHLGELAFVDADHKAAEFDSPESLTFTDKISFRRFDYQMEFNSFQLRTQFNHCELVLVNGNHFKASSQILVIDPKKPLDRKLDRISDPILVINKDAAEIPSYLDEYIKDIPVVSWEQQKEVGDFVEKWLLNRRPEIKGLVLAGGKSVRMKKDKGGLSYHGISQRKHLYNQLDQLGVDTVVSCRTEQIGGIENDLPVMPDTFQDLGPMGALLTAFRKDPQSAWLAVACDLPFLTTETLHYLIENRDPSKIATAFKSPYDEFPEPLITIWEPRSYSVLLSFLSQGYSCPRKVLINSAIHLLEVPDIKSLDNVNLPEEYQEAMKSLGR